MHLLSINDVLAKGLQFVKVRNPDQLSKSQKEIKFQKHYGSDALTLADMWFALTTTDIKKAKLKSKEKRQGFKMFMCAHYFIWNYPRNSDILASRFDMCEYNARGKPLWKWVKKIAALKKKVIVWDEKKMNPNDAIMCITIDGTDKRTYEKKHPTLPIDKGIFTKKHNHGGLKYQIVLSLNTSDCIHVYGPRRGGENDKTMLENSGVLDKLKNGKLAIVDGGYVNFKNKGKLSWPNPHDSKDVKKFKARARARHETFVVFWNFESDFPPRPQTTHRKWCLASTKLLFQSSNVYPIVYT